MPTALQAEGRFRWYTMTELAGFLNQRDAVQWTLLAHLSGQGLSARLSSQDTCSPDLDLSSGILRRRDE